MDADRRRTWVLLLIGFAVPGVAVLVAGRAAAGGSSVYAIDDAYIHLALTRTLVHHGTFGLVPGIYESASSAPLWELLLAPFSALSPSGTWPPLLVNVAAATWVLWSLSGLPVLQRTCRRSARGGGGGPLGIAGVVLLPTALGLVPLVATGMEHTLHMAIAVAVIVRVARMLDLGPVDGSPAPGVVPLAALLAVGALVRFETLFLAGAVAVAFVPARRIGAAAIAVASAVVPVAAFAVANTRFGQYALPNSVVAKSAVGGGSLLPPVSDVIERLLHDPLLLCATAVLLAAVAHAVRTRPGGFRDPATGVLLVPLLAIVAQLLFGDVGWFERYQAWLIAISITALLLTIPAERVAAATSRPIPIALVLATVLRLPLLINTPLAMQNIHQNQEQLGRFLADAYPGRGVIVNDIGWVAWAHDGPLVDIYGLGSADLLRARKEGRLDRAMVADQAAATGSEVMAVYPDVFGGIVPEGWQEAGRWCVTTRRYVLSAECVAFYAPPGAPSEHLRQALVAHAPRLPEGVTSSVVG